MSSPAPNPYASPHTTTQLKPAPGEGRASPAKLQWVIGLMIVSEISYLANWLAILALVTNTGFQNVLLPIILAIMGVVWISTVLLIFLCGSRVFWIAALTLPIPFFGIIPMLFSINFARNFLLRNGYRPGIIGAHPDTDELAEMDTNPNYRPSLLFKRDGSRHRLPFSLTLIIAACLILVAIANALL